MFALFSGALDVRCSLSFGHTRCSPIIFRRAWRLLFSRLTAFKNERRLYSTKGTQNLLCVRHNDAAYTMCGKGCSANRITTAAPGNPKSQAAIFAWLAVEQNISSRVRKMAWSVVMLAPWVMLGSGKTDNGDRTRRSRTSTHLKGRRARHLPALNSEVDGVAAHSVPPRPRFLTAHRLWGSFVHSPERRNSITQEQCPRLATYFALDVTGALHHDLVGTLHRSTGFPG